MDKSIYCLRGPSGSGKNHWIRSAMHHPEFVKMNHPNGEERDIYLGPDALVVSADDYFMVDDRYCFDPNKIGEAHKQCMQQFLAAVSEDTGVIVVNNTNIGAWEIAPYAALAAAFDYTFTIVQMNTPIETCCARRGPGQDKEIPAYILGAMKEAMWRETLPPFWNRVFVTSK